MLIGLAKAKPRVERQRLQAKSFGHLGLGKAVEFGLRGCRARGSG